MDMQHKRVLLIDDDQDDAEIFSDALRELNLAATFHHVNDGRKALEQLRQADPPTPHVIFLDINMPILDGWQCLREIKTVAELAHIPIIMYSTSNLHNTGMKPGDVGATAFMTKPDSFRDLKLRLGELLGQILV